MCSMKVRSVASRTRAPGTELTASVRRGQSAASPVSTVMSRIVCGPSTVTRSTAPIVPPASPMAEATLPSIPGRWSISTRRVRLYCALGLEAEISSPLEAMVGASYAPDRCRGMGSHPTPAHDRAGQRDSLRIDGGRALFDRRQQPRLPGVLRPPRVDRHLDGRAHQRHLRLRLDAGED